MRYTVVSHDSKVNCRRKSHAARVRVRVVSGNLPILPPSWLFVLARSGIKRRVVGQLGQANANYSHILQQICFDWLAVHGYKPSVQHSKSKAIEAVTLAACTAISSFSPCPFIFTQSAKQTYALTICQLDWLYHNRTWIACEMQWP